MCLMLILFDSWSKLLFPRITNFHVISPSRVKVVLKVKTILMRLSHHFFFNQVNVNTNIVYNNNVMEYLFNHHKGYNSNKLTISPLDIRFSTTLIHYFYHRY